MTTPAPRKRVPKTVWDLVFTLLIPIFILSPTGLGSGVVVSDLLGGGTRGNTNAYLVAALIPVAYVAWDFIRNRSLSPIAIFGGLTALVNGALAFWTVDGWQFALKDSATRFLTFAFALGSVAVGMPLFRIFLDVVSLTEKEEGRRATQLAMAHPNVKRALGHATLVLAVVELIAGIINYVVNLHLVQAKFGTAAFNAQVAEANAVLRLPAMGIFLVGFALGFYVITRAVTHTYGAGVNLFEPDALAQRLRERGELT
ncbi:VC0807 family protein [Deinococcus maricopensis]|uniref:MFS transporter n=1 Tax=Deinococcus maricopensis (strain DSM 21211 / LMG 22137 / NRRL B-23946 / LB-34) TaxID=709986 RepID=E8U4G6_DEIML|nr:VC0807 family protein [Deinococcus maricopensis]ADV68831.1 hypothetical protein Deima_3203 [Deinococcus maricopensis DSM 21211]